MQQETEIQILCPEHNEVIISCSITQEKTLKMYCMKCLTSNQMSIQQITKSLNDLICNQMSTLCDQQLQRQKRLNSLEQAYTQTRDNFNEKINAIIKMIADKMNECQNRIFQKNDHFNELSQSPTLQQLEQIIQVLNDEKILDQVTFEKEDQEVESKAVKQFQQLLQYLNKKQYQWIIDQKEKQEIVISEKKFGQYELMYDKKGIIACNVIAMNESEKILANGQRNDILLWNFCEDGQITLKQTLSGHSNTIHCLCFAKKNNLLISGSYDNTLRIWLEQTDWICYQVLEGHKSWVYDVVLNLEEDQIISCSKDERIKVWMKTHQWECRQTLTNPTSFVYFLSLSPDCTQLASVGQDGLRIWKKQWNELWCQTQVVECPQKDLYIRVIFINNHEMIATTKKQGKMIRLMQTASGLFYIVQEIHLNKQEEYDDYLFPIAYNYEWNLLVCRHSKEHIYIVIRQQDGSFQVHQILNGDYSARHITKDGKYLILGDKKGNSLQVWKMK